MKNIFLFLSTLVMSSTVCSHTFLTESAIQNGGYLGGVYYGQFALNESELITTYNQKMGLVFTVPQLVRLICKTSENNNNTRSAPDIESSDSIFEVNSSGTGGSDSPGPAGVCGEIDFSKRSTGESDDFNTAYIASNHTCHVLAITEGIDVSRIAPIYYGPSSFVNAGTAAYGHHGEHVDDGIAGYNLSEGLTFSCVTLIPAIVAESEKFIQ